MTPVTRSDWLGGGASFSSAPASGVSNVSPIAASIYVANEALSIAINPGF